MDSKNGKPNLNSIHELQERKRKARQKNIYDKLQKIKQTDKNLNSLNRKPRRERKEEIKKDEVKENIAIDKNKESQKREPRRSGEKEKIVKDSKEQKKSEHNKAEKNIKNTKNKKENKNNKKSKKLKTEKEWKKSRIIKSIIIAILLIIISLMSYFIYLIYLNGGGLKGMIAASLGHTPNKVENLKPINVLILGTNENNTDSIILVSYNPKTQEASMLSIPRDTFVGTNVNTAPASHKINAIYAIQGIKPMVKKVEELTGLDIPYYAILKVENIPNLVDLLGKVEFDVPIDMNYDDGSQDLAINLKAGRQMIGGKEAAMLLRFRHNNDGSTYPAAYGVEDIGRMRTQREFIKAAIKSMISKFDINKIYDIASKADEFLETNIKFKDYKDYIPYLMEFNPSDIKVARVEGSGVLTTYYFFLPDYDQLDDIIFDLFVFSDDERKEHPEKFEVKRNINQIVKPEPKSIVSPDMQDEISKKSMEREEEAIQTQINTKNNKTNINSKNNEQNINNEENKNKNQNVESKKEEKPSTKKEEIPAPAPKPDVKPVPSPSPKPEEVKNSESVDAN